MNVACGQRQHAGQRLGCKIDAVPLIPPKRLPVKVQQPQPSSGCGQKTYYPPQTTVGQGSEHPETAFYRIRTKPR